MSEFWSGVASGLIGAIIGGLFTAAGVRVQVKASLQAAQLQVNAMIEQQSISAVLSMRQWAVMQVTAGLEAVKTEVEALYQSHEHPEREAADGARCRGHDFRRDALNYARNWRRQLNHSLAAYGGYLNRESIATVDRVFEYLPAENSVDRMAGSLKGDCLYSFWLDRLDDLLLEAMDEIPYRMGLSNQVPSHVRS
ncbi:hypothetical protein [Micromonospora sp. WMMA1996]|uniref:hypothetical protein n=1 Tax=Micromonospora sp. WMMA1996 TaxID=2039878 RepID=UPI0011456241|nr:hypothetical protein [Micromonospora sp. WMMA1996]